MTDREIQLEHYLFWRLDCVDSDAQLRGNLLIDGDDALEFFEHLEGEFGYAAGRENFYDFFQDEYSCGIWPRFKRWILGKNIDLPVLTIQDVTHCTLNNIPLQSATNLRIK